MAGQCHLKNGGYFCIDYFHLRRGNVADLLRWFLWPSNLRRRVMTDLVQNDSSYALESGFEAFVASLKMLPFSRS